MIRWGNSSLGAFQGSQVACRFDREECPFYKCDYKIMYRTNILCFLYNIVILMGTPITPINDQMGQFVVRGFLGVSSCVQLWSRRVSKLRAAFSRFLTRNCPTEVSQKIVTKGRHRAIFQFSLFHRTIHKKFVPQKRHKKCA